MRRLVGVIGLGLLGAARAGHAQVMDFFVPGNDTALAILTGGRATADLRVCGSGASSYDVTIFLDDSRVRLVQADSVPGYNLPRPTVTPGTNQVTIAAAGTGSASCYTYLARLTFELDSLAQSGSLISLRVNTLINGLSANVLASHTTSVLRVCQAEVLRGDVTADRRVTSRDALVALTAAVGLPVPGFQVLPGGDIDLDGAATSRDALFMLSLGVGVYTGFEGNIKGIARACDPLFPVPDDMLFFRSASVYGVAAGDTMPRQYGAPDGYNAYPARWSPDRSRILYTAYTPSFYYELVAFDTLSGATDTLVRNVYFDAGGDWSPDGTRIAFVSQRTFPYRLYVMDANGAGQAVVTTGVTVNTSLAVSWSPDGTRIAVAACQTCGGDGIWVVSPDGSGLTEVLQGSLNHNPGSPVWSAAGDSLYYYRNDGYVWAVAAQPAATPVRQSPLAGGVGSDAPGATTLGAAFRSFLRSPYDFFLRRSADGRHLRVHRNSQNNDVRPSFRRPASPYVDTVRVTPDTLDLSVSDQPTGNLTATVVNSDGSPAAVPVTWLSRNETLITVDAAGLVTALDTTSGVYVVATVGGWRSDSALVRSSP
ncbi:MAG TPA: hypothetical protein VD793_02415 [Gemmatimonadales bacterium]|nr:hypothetical protein [Gemmatimonadales bacterium]